MGKQSTRENKTIYQLCREAAGLTRAEASEKMNAVSASKIEKFEYETQEPTPYDILQMADAHQKEDEHRLQRVLATAAGLLASAPGLVSGSGPQAVAPTRAESQHSRVVV